MTTGTHTRVFLARLAGVLAFDPFGDQVGKVRDFVVTHSPSGPPLVIGLILEVPMKRRVFLPIGRVKSFDANQVIVSGIINMRRFERRAGETLVFAELFDKRITLADGEDPVTVIDVGISLNRQWNWETDKIYVKRGGGFRRRGESSVVDWAETRGFLDPDPGQGASLLLVTLKTMRAADVAEALRDMTFERRMQVARELPDERLADVLEELPEDDQVEILEQLELERAADILEEMDPDDAADLIGELDPARARDLLERMEPDEADDIRRLMAYEDHTAGGMMTTEPLILPYNATVAQALAMIRQPDLSPALASQVYIVRSPLETPTGHFLGTVHFQRLLREPPSQLVSGLADADMEPIGPQTSLAEVARYFATYNLVAAPVVDAGDHLLGAVTVDDVVDHMLPEDWRGADHGRS